MHLYTIRRRDFWDTPEALQESAARSAQVGDEMSDDVRWIRSYVVREGSGKLGTVCTARSTPSAATRTRRSRCWPAA